MDIRRNTMSDDKERILLGLKYAAVLESITDDSLSSLASALDGDLKDAFAKVTGLSAEAYATPASLGGAIRDGISRRRASHDAGIILGEPCAQHCIEKLGDASEDPSLEELHAVLPEALETFGLDAVRLMVVQYSRSLVGFRQLVATDARFASTSSSAAVTVRAVDEDAQAAKRAIRKERKERERTAKKKQSGR